LQFQVSLLLFMHHLKYKLCVSVIILVSQPLTKALESTSKTFEDIGKLYVEEVILNHLITFWA